MRIRLFGAVIALVGCAAVASAQQPVPPVPASPVPALPLITTQQPAVNPPGLTPVPVLPPSTLPPAVPPAPPPIIYANPSCGTPAAPCHDKKAKRESVFGKLFIGSGTASPVACGCFAAEKTFMWGGCKQFFTPGKTCGGCGLDYGPGGLGNCDNCHHVTSFLNR